MKSVNPEWDIRSLLKALATIALFGILASSVSAQEKKPNIVVIFGDDIGMWNVGAYTHGMIIPHEKRL